MITGSLATTAPADDADVAGNTSAIALVNTATNDKRTRITSPEVSRRVASLAFPGRDRKVSVRPAQELSRGGIAKSLAPPSRHTRGVPRREPPVAIADLDLGPGGSPRKG